MPVSNLRSKIVGLVLFTIVTSGMLAVFYFKSGQRAPLSSAPYEATIVVPDAATLVSNGDVRSAGIRVGSVRSVKHTKDGQAQVRVQLEDDFGPLAQDARARVRLKTVLGESYLAIQPGSGKSGMVPNGGWLNAANVDKQVQLDEILSTFDARTRQRLKENLARIAGGVRGRGADLNATLAAAEPALGDGRAVLSVLSRQRENLAGVLRNTSTLFKTLADRDRALQQLFTQAKATAAAAASRDESLARTVRQLPGTLRHVKSVTASLSSFSSVATPVLADLTAGATALTPTVRELGPAARSARELLRRVPRLVNAANPLLVKLRSFSRVAPELTETLPKLLCETTPALDYLAPFHREAGAFFGNVSMTPDAIDPLGRTPIIVYPTVDPNSLRVFDSAARKQAEKLINAFGVHVYGPMKYNPYPKPGTVGNPQPFDGKVPRVDAGC